MKLYILKPLLILFIWAIPQFIFAQFTAGVSVFDSTGYIEYIPGNLPIVISVPHGGYLKPAIIPDRNCTGCVYTRDSYTQELGREIGEDFYKATGCYPHVIINLLHRKKLDANRDIGDAADGDLIAEQAWFGYHRFIDSAKSQIVNEYGRGLFIDLHGHAHSIQRIEIGYRLSKTQLQLPDATLNQNSLIAQSSIRSLVDSNLQLLSHSELLRGSQSFGTLLENKGISAIPSNTNPFPLGSDPYFSGGYNTGRHGSENGGNIDGIQLECHHNVRFDSIARKLFADSLTKVINEYISLHYNNHYENNYCNLLSGLYDNNLDDKINIYPNPVDDYLNIETNMDNMDISIYNCLGQKIKSFIWNKSPINVSFLKNGYYFIEFKDNTKLLAVKKLIKI